MHLCLEHKTLIRWSSLENPKMSNSGLMECSHNIKFKLYQMQFFIFPTYNQQKMHEVYSKQ